MTYEDLISLHLTTLDTEQKETWLKDMINIFENIKSPDFIDKSILCILTRKLALIG